MIFCFVLWGGGYHILCCFMCTKYQTRKFPNPTSKSHKFSNHEQFVDFNDDLTLFNLLCKNRFNFQIWQKNGSGSTKLRKDDI